MVTASHIRPGITGKLFLAILAVCALTVLGMGLAARLSFQTGFLDYLTEIEDTRVSALAEELAEDYSQTGTWDSLREPRAWRRLINRFVRHEPDTAARGKKGKKGSESGPEQDTPAGETPAERARRNWERAHLRSTLGLVALDKQTLIAGQPPGPDAYWSPITLEGKGIGWLTREPLTGITDAVDLRFQEKQRTAFALIALFSLALAATCALIMARVLIAPLRRFAAATGRLASGDFSARVSPAPPQDILRNTAVSTAAGEHPHYDELEVLAAQLNRLAGALEANENARRTFMAEIAHDLRTPLSILRGEIEALEDGLRAVTPESLASLRVEVEILGRLVDDIQTLSLADLGCLRYDMRALNLVDSLESALFATRDRIAAQGLSLEADLPDAPVTVMADPARIAQVLRNVLENSLRYTDPGGCIRVRCATDHANVCVDVFDSPPAVPEDQLSSLFERFHSGDPSRNRARGGSGLGLAICKTLVEAHAGQISARPSPLGGLWIRLCLPIMEDA
ncbi:MAG: ATP-binding protein [Desulfovibrionaceae bacterium]|nr:ATP-binding protein [Desulfovibrionaceae bacterium]